MTAALALFVSDRVLSYFSNAERNFTPEINKNYDLNDLIQRLERASGGDYKGYYDIDRHNEKYVFSTLDDMIVPYTIPYLLQGNDRLTLENGEEIPLRAGDWLVPVLIRKEEQENNWKENIHLLLPSNLVGDLKHGDTLGLMYKGTVFNITITNADPQYQNDFSLRDQPFAQQVLNAESQLYPKNTIEEEANGAYRRPSTLRREGRMKARLAEIPDLIETMKANRDSTYKFDKETQKFVKIGRLDNISAEQIRDIDRTVEFRAPDLDSDAQPGVGPKGFGLYCYTETAKVVMTIASDKLIFWQHNEPVELPASLPKVLRNKILKTTDVFTVLPLNSGTISADQIKSNLDKIKFHSNVAIDLKI